MAMHKVDRPFEVKKITDDGRFKGIASPFGEIDYQRDIVMPGAFTKSLQGLVAKGRKLPMLWQHNARQPIGVYLVLSETDKALEVEGECNLDVQQGRECHALMKQGALSGLSIGFNTIRDEWDEKGIVRKLFEVDLMEISPVTFPAADSARVTLVKSIEQTESLSECEAILRDAGMSAREAVTFIARVKAIASQRDSADAVSRALATLRSTR